MAIMPVPPVVPATRGEVQGDATPLTHRRNWESVHFIHDSLGDPA